ncbi:hypothetical protein DFQ05_0417 [Winogradskyella wandonensis]|uniref:BNR/Asp-box repeat protein n=1 Tax=Winogradskyella wandonensis TaxID=1442586 RepID=A0A4R1KW10_9FLAO|nr:oxidoreductase [Winogradskyella wandonensis]TCK68907.1 hypothetical protein DFQ05_0417 [Winogradskyella wandonensis]
MRLLVICFVLICLSSCTSKKTIKSRSISEVKIETLLQDSTLNVRALEVKFNKVTVAASNGHFYRLFYDKKTIGRINFDNGKNDLDSIGNNNFRAITITDHPKTNTYFPVFGITIGSPAKLYKHGTLVYQENHPKAFYDSMDFWNDQEGIAMGDPTDDCISIIITRDGGESWTKLSCDDLPKAVEGEAAFAASDTNIAIVGDNTWIATGGMASRILYSPDKGKTWTVYDTPIIQGKPTTGIYSIDFYDAKNGFAIGGDYTKPNDSLNNKIRTADGGKTWQVVGNGKSPGYRSCVQYVPNGNAKELVAVGIKGIDYSNDGGENWKHLSDEGFYTIRFLNDSVAYAAGNGRISKLTFR